MYRNLRERDLITKIKELREDEVAELAEFIDFLKFKATKTGLKKAQKLELLEKIKGLWANDERIEEAFKILDQGWKEWRIALS